LDDNKSILDVLALSLRTYLKGCSILTASNGASGVEFLKARKVDLILTDLDMPVMNGYVFLEHAKEIQPDAPLFVMTGDCTHDIAERLRSLGVRWCIEKPFNFDELTRRISEELKRDSPTAAQGMGRPQEFVVRHPRRSAC
jgi:two-component system capsular synthesis sensor histidine kinase RcsC